MEQGGEKKTPTVIKHKSLLDIPYEGIFSIFETFTRPPGHYR